MIYRTSQEKITEYEQSDRLNQSMIKVLLSQGMEAFVAQRVALLADTKEYGEKEYQIIGKGVDCKITMGEDCFAKNYYTDTKPGGTSKVIPIVKRVYDNLKVSNSVEFNKAVIGALGLAAYRDWILDACDTEEFYMNYKGKNDQTRIDKVLKEGETYWQSLIKAGDRQVIDSKQDWLIKTITYNILNRKHTAKLFQDSENIDLIYQCVLYFEYDGVLCEALLDLLRIDHLRRWIIPMDIKTDRNSVLLFGDTIRVRRYDIQGSFYHHAVGESLVDISNMIGKEVTGYEIKGFGFVAESTTSPGTPLKFVLTPEALRVGYLGDGSYKKGWHQAIQSYKEWDAVGFSIERRLEESNGTLRVEHNYNYNIML